MLEATVEPIVKDLVASLCGIPAVEISGEGRLIEYGLDSVRAIDLLVSLEDAFAMEVPDDVAQRVRTVSDVTRYIAKRLAVADTAAAQA
jgi:acyl carrier protein